RELSSSGHAVVVADLGPAPTPPRAAPDLGARAWVCAGNDAAAVLAAAGRAAGPIGGIVHLAALVAGPRLDSADLEGWEPLLWAQRLARAQDPSAGGLFFAATAQDGKLGLAGGTMLGAALAGHAKALARERPDELVKAIDVRLEDGADSIAAALARELRSGNAAPEVGIAAGERYEPD